MIVILVESLSGNTKRIAEIIQGEVGGELHTRRTAPTDAEFYFIGTYTIGYGSAPKPILRWVEDNPQVEGRTAVFGSGETQWGEENFCGAVDVVAEKTKSKFEVLKIEQYPAQKRQIDKIKEWSNEIKCK